MKSLLSNLRMTKKLLVSPVTAILFLIIFAIVSYGGFLRQKSALDDVYGNRFINYKTSSDIIVGLKGVYGNAYKLVSLIKSGQGKEKIEELANKQLDVIKQTEDVMQDMLKRKSLTKDERSCLTAAVGYLPQYQDLLRQIASSDAGTASVLIYQADDQFQAISDNLNQLLSLENELSKNQYSVAVSIFRTVLIVTAIVLLAAIILPLCISLMMKTVILRPVRQTVETIEAAAGGDLTKLIDLSSDDEIGEMARHFNAFIDKLNDAVTHVARSSEEVLAAANKLDQAAGAMASGVEYAVVQVSSVATASEEMSKTSLEIAKNCLVAVQSSQEADRSASTGETVLKKTICLMEQINHRVKNSAEVLKNLGVRSDQIGQIVGLINDVADQTNLLALNAAIEAARAGEHGRGFAVVADEVRKLAEQTTHATKEISGTVYAMQAEIKRVVSSMEEGVGEVAEGVSEAARSGEALKGILAQIGKLSAEINQIAVASEEETATTNEIASSIQQISRVMQETAASIQENAAASSQLTGLSNGLHTLVGQFRLKKRPDHET